MTVDDIVRVYEKNLFQTYADFSQELERLLERQLKERQIEYITLEHRAKAVESFRKKISDKSYEDPLRQVTDLCGARIVVRQTSDVERVVKFVEDKFVVDDENSINKAKRLKANEFGYLSVHLVVTLSDEQIEYGAYRKYRDLKAEIQIRTTLQHAWAVIDHMLKYKSESHLSYEFERRLIRLTALFELGDQEIDLLVQQKNEMPNYYAEKVNQGYRDIEVNADSLQAYIENAREVSYWTDFASMIHPHQISARDAPPTTVKFIQYCGLTTLEDIERVLVDARRWGKGFLPEAFDDQAKHDRCPIEEVEMSQTQLILSLIIAANAEHLSDEILEKEFGFPHTGIIRIALRSRGIRPATKRAIRARPSKVKRRSR